MPAILVASHRRQQLMTILQCSQLLSAHTSEHDQIRVSCQPLPTPPKRSFHTHGSLLHPSTRSGRATAASWLDLAVNDELREWEEKRGGFYQHDSTKSLVCSFLDESAVDVDATSLRLAALKLLRASQGRGEQEIHYDITEYDRALLAALRCHR